VGRLCAPMACEHDICEYVWVAATCVCCCRRTNGTAPGKGVYSIDIWWAIVCKGHKSTEWVVLMPDRSGHTPPGLIGKGCGHSTITGCAAARKPKHHTALLQAHTQAAPHPQAICAHTLRPTCDASMRQWLPLHYTQAKVCDEDM
jgi:hypothetical protein